ncbi:hypothetical protein [Anabaena sp. CCY 9910]|uniref:hypothetical protein n=1 Tax=Anabaena sp. CCY 9910 TaxID=3103870 RepID=UPI0039DFA70A
MPTLLWFWWAMPTIQILNTNSINDCKTSLGEDAMNPLDEEDAIHRVSTNGLFVAFFSNWYNFL